MKRLNGLVLDWQQPNAFLLPILEGRYLDDIFDILLPSLHHDKSFCIRMEGSRSLTGTSGPSHCLMCSSIPTSEFKLIDLLIRDKQVGVITEDLVCTGNWV